MKSIHYKIASLLSLFLGMATYPLMEIFYPDHGKWSYVCEHHTWQNFDVGMLGWLIGIFFAIVLFIYSETKE